MEQIQLIKTIYGKTSFNSVVDTSFSQLVQTTATASFVAEQTVEKFFQLYDQLFYDIYPSGSSQTHLELVTRSSEYLGIALADLEEEIRQLRSENTSLKNQLFNLSFGDRSIKI